MPTRLPLVVLFPILSAVTALGQGSAADYERSANLAKTWRDLVLNESLDPTWSGPHELLYWRQTAREGWELVVVDARTGEKRPAFDHVAVAARLGELLSREIDPARLPSARFAHRDDALFLFLEDDLLGLRIDRADGSITEAAIDSIDAFTLPRTRRRRSRDLGDETTVLFVNRSDAPVEVIWLDRDGAPRPYATLKLGERHRQRTFAGHVWLIVAEDGRELGLFAAQDSPGVVLIDQPPLDEAESSDAPPESRRRSRRRSPDGRWRAFIRDHDLYLVETDSGEEHRLTADGTPDDHYLERIHWSPDSTKLVVMRATPPQEHLVRLIESAPRDQTQPKLHELSYLKPGDRIAKPRPVLFDVESLRTIEISHELFPNPWSISRETWRPDGSAFSFVYNERGHQLVRLVEIDAETGAARTIVEERSESFVDYAHKLFLHHLESAGELIWMSERSGWNHLYRIDAGTGRVVLPITQGDWVVRDVERVDEEKGVVWFRACGVFPEQDPYHIHHGRVNLDGTGLIWLTGGDGTHRVESSPDGQYYVDTWSRVDLSPVHELRRGYDGSLITELEHGDASPLIEAGWRPPERFHAKGRDGQTDIWGVIHHPSNFDPSRSYPVIEQIYAGPHGQHVPKRFRAWHGAQEIAELGFVVVQIDGMGTNWRSKAFHDVCWQNLGDAGFPDRIAWLRAAAARHPYMDLSRVGIFGGSAGGQNALRALLVHGDFYRAAVADCGCHDNRMDKVWWNELWMGWPIGPHYEEQSNVTQAHRLEGELLLIVGELDRNVDPASTMQVVDALIRADKDFELLVMPGVGHGAAGTPYGRRRQRDFFVRHLLGQTPRWKP